MLGKLWENLGPVTAIFVTGDIAYAGKADEYRQARDWLMALAQKMGCASKDILTVPGKPRCELNFP